MGATTKRHRKRSSSSRQVSASGAWGTHHARGTPGSEPSSPSGSGRGKKDRRISARAPHTSWRSCRNAAPVCLKPLSELVSALPDSRRRGSRNSVKTEPSLGQRVSPPRGSAGAPRRRRCGRPKAKKRAKTVLPPGWVKLVADELERRAAKAAAKPEVRRWRCPGCGEKVAKPGTCGRNCALLIWSLRTGGLPSA